MAAVETNDGSKCFCCCAEKFADDFALVLLGEDRNTVYHAILMQRKVMTIATTENTALINIMLSLSLLPSLVGQNKPSDDGNTVDITDSSDDATLTETNLHVEAVTTNRMIASEPRIDVIHAATFVRHICDRPAVVDTTLNILQH